MIKSLGITFWYGILCAGFVVVVIVELLFVTSHLQEISANETKINADLATLKGRLETLKNVGPTITDSVNLTTQALPTDNSSLIVSSQIRRLAASHLLTLKSLSLSILPKSDSEDLSTTEISFSTSSQTTDVLLFIKELLNITPLVNINSLNIASTTGSSIAQFSINSFWSPLPTKLPALNEPLKNLSEEESQMLEIISKKLPPSFIEASGSAVTSSASGGIRTNPFAPAI